MRNFWAVVIPLVLLALSSGCSMSKKTLPVEAEDRNKKWGYRAFQTI